MESCSSAARGSSKRSTRCTNAPAKTSLIAEFLRDKPNLFYVAMRREEEIDFVAAGEASAIFGACKWRNEATDADALDTLMRRARLLPQYTERNYAIVSRSGFTDRLRAQAAARRDVRLIEAKALLEPLPEGMW